MVLLNLNDGNVTYESLTAPKDAELTMICKGNMVQEIIHNDLYWDEMARWILVYIF